MFGSEVLDVLIGMAFIYLLLSLVASAVREGVESLLKARAVHLERGIRELLDDQTNAGLVTHLYNHPLVFSLYKGKYTSDPTRMLGRSLPTYIPSRAFAQALVDLVTRGPAGNALSVYDAVTPGITVQGVRAALPTVQSPRLARMMTLLTDGAADIEQVIANTEQWFNDAMEQVSAVYRRRTQWGVLIIAAIVSVALNVDSIAIANHLARSKGAREALVARAATYLKENDRPSTSAATQADTTVASVQARADSTQAVLRRQVADLQSLDIPLGWSYVAHAPGNAPAADTTGWGILTKIFGLLVTTFAVSLGAPFWFDLLKRVVSIRSTVKPGEEEKKTTDEKARTGTRGPNTTPSSGPTASVVPGSVTAASSAAAPTSAPPNSQVPPTGYVPHQWTTGPADEGLL